jgi:hypothetical protein
LILAAEVALRAAGYDTSSLQVLIRADMPPGYRGMSLDDGAVLGSEAFSSQAMVNYVLEEELLHLMQKTDASERWFKPGIARTLEEEVHEQRKFPFPGN